ncbi:MAG: hypothetical protein MJ230_01655 [bacterium]|nr:hypothetical protein [bacterium]
MEMEEIRRYDKDYRIKASVCVRCWKCSDYTNNKCLGMCDFDKYDCPKRGIRR